MKKPRGITLACNWKMNQTRAESKDFFEQLDLKTCPEILHLYVIPSFLSLETCLSQALPFPLKIAAQNAHGKLQGAYTGEVSGPMLAELGITTVLLGHSERRQYFGETDASLLERASGLLQQGFQIIFCLGETLEDYEKGHTEDVLKKQLEYLLPSNGPGLKAYFNGSIILAYEPVWAIGTGIQAKPEQIQRIHGMLRTLLEKATGKADQTSLIYGGSVTAESLSSLLACSEIDGALVGSASLQAKKFLQLVQEALRFL